MIYAQIVSRIHQYPFQNIVFALDLCSFCYTLLPEFIVEIRYFTVSLITLPLLSSTIMTDVVLSQRNIFTVFLVLGH